MLGHARGWRVAMAAAWRIAPVAWALAVAVWGNGCENLPGDAAAEVVLDIAGQDAPYVMSIGDTAELEWAVLTREGRDIGELYDVPDLEFVPHETNVARVRYTYRRAHVDAVGTGRTHLELRLPSEQLVTYLELTVVP